MWNACALGKQRAAYSFSRSFRPRWFVVGWGLWECEVSLHTPLARGMRCMAGGQNLLEGCIQHQCEEVRTMVGGLPTSEALCLPDSRVSCLRFFMPIHPPSRPPHRPRPVIHPPHHPRSPLAHPTLHPLHHPRAPLAPPPPIHPATPVENRMLWTIVRPSCRLNRDLGPFGFGH